MGEDTYWDIEATSDERFDLGSTGLSSFGTLKATQTLLPFCIKTLDPVVTLVFLKLTFDLFSLSLCSALALSMFSNTFCYLPATLADL